MQQALRLCSVLLLGLVASAGIVEGALSDTNPPICTALPDHAPTPKVDGSATDLLLGDSGIDSVTLAVAAGPFFAVRSRRNTAGAG